MKIHLTRPDGVMAWLPTQGDVNNFKTDEKLVFISWEDIKALELERKGYEVVKESARALRKKRR